jgi:molecular chaperone DnaK
MAIAYGAALIAAQHTGAPGRDAARAAPGARPLQRISAFDLGCRVYDRATQTMTIDTVIPQNTPVPHRATRTYYTNRADQKRIIVEVVQAKSPAEGPTHLGYFAFAVDRPRKDLPLEVTFGYDEQGMVTVVARDPETGREVKRDFSGTPHPSDRILAQKALLDSVALAE